MWKRIEEFPDYEVNEIGEVRNAATGYVKSQRISKQGYPVVNLTRDGKVYKCTVHRLVAAAFIPRDAGKPCVNHKDENKQNNRVDNLEWCDVYYNNHYGDRMKKCAFNKARSVSMNKDGVVVAVFTSIVEMANAFGVSPTIIGKKLRKSNTGYWRGYHLSYTYPGTNKSAGLSL